MSFVMVRSLQLCAEMMNRLSSCLIALALSQALGCLAEDRGFEEFGDDQGGGKADGDGLARLDVNDVSILYPLPVSAANLGDLLGLDTMTASGPLLTREQFTALVATIHPEDDASLLGMDYADWRIVGVRVDPCEMLVPGMGCTPQLRLVAQSFDHTHQATLVSADDNAIHLAFSIPADHSVPIMRDLVALKTASGTVNTNGKPLGVHPTLGKQGLKGELATKLRGLVTTYAGKAVALNLSTMFTLVGALGSTEWRFGAGAVVAGTVHQIPVPCSAEPTITMIGLSNGATRVIPGGTCADNINEIINSNGRTAPFFMLSKSAQAHDVDLALRVINPNLNRIGTTDCVGCHMASRALARVKDTKFLNLNDGNPNRFVPPKGTTTTYATSKGDATGHYQVRAFGYNNREVAYAQATVHLSALAADFINTKIRTEHILTP